MNMTPQQQEVVRAKVGNMLVSAAAGSGKTSVMTERIAERILSGALDVRRVLVMTFTEAASSNMQQKIMDRLNAALSGEEDPDQRRHIAEQLSFLPTAHISTIHSFCLDIIRNFGYDARTPDGGIAVEPGFSTIDPTKVRLLFREAVEDVLSALYEQSFAVLENDSPEKRKPVTSERDRSGRVTRPFRVTGEDVTKEQWFLDFNRMTLSLSGPRDDSGLREMIESFHSYLRSMPDYEKWIVGKLQEMKAASMDFEESRGAKALMSDFRTALALARNVLPQLETLLDQVVFVKDKNKNTVYSEYYAAQLRVLRRLADSDQAGTLSWDSAVQASGELPDGKGASESKKGDNTAKEEFFELYAFAKEILFYLTGKVSPKGAEKSFRTPARHLFGRSTKELGEDLSYMLPVAERLFEVLLLVDDRYSAMKRAENGVDFSDYEHLALLLLSRGDAGKYYREAFSEIYIDEYQDNSRIQDAIVSLFSNGNCFAVGDVKQSIYRFRHARPQLFLDRMQLYRDTDDGLLLELNRNFRSRPGILRFVNRIFSQILSRSSGEIDYDDTQMLYPGKEAGEEEDAEAPVQMILLDLTDIGTGDRNGEEESPAEGDDAGSGAEAEDTDEGSASGDTDASDGEDAADLKKIEKEAIAVIAKISELRQKHNTAWKDIAILARSNQEAAAYSGFLAAAGIPSEGGTGTEFLSNRELLLMENLMKLLDNFRQDIPLAAILHSDFPKASFTPEEMLRIELDAASAGSTGKYYHEHFLYYAAHAEDQPLAHKVHAFLDWIGSLRSRAMYLKVSELIEHVYVETGIRERCGSLPDGAARVTALETFREWAGRYESGGHGGLYRFVTYLEDIRNRKETPDDFDTVTQEHDVVRCMTFHKSKGLEFRNVFVVGLEHAFRSEESRAKVLLSEKFGIGIDYIEPEAGYRFPTHSKIAVEREEQLAALAENMRVLYVAMTRAEERLFLVGCISRRKDLSIGTSASLIRLAREEKDTALPAWLVQKSKSNLDLCLLALARNAALPLDALLSEDEAGGILSSGVYGSSGDLEIAIGPFREFSDLPRTLPEMPEEADREPLHEPSTAGPGEERLFRLQYAGTYPYEDLTRIPAKITVSELKRRINDTNWKDDEEHAVPPAGLLSDDMRSVNMTVRPVRPGGEKAKTLSATETGTLLHSVFQYADFGSLRENADSADIARMIRDLVSHRMIREKHIVHIEPYYDSIRGFAASDLARRITKAEKTKGNGPFREIPFSISVPAGKGGTSLVQGMIDCWFIEDGEAVLIDYKSDQIAGDRSMKESVLRERYALQLDYYAQAIEAASGLNVREKIIWLIRDSLSFLL